MSIKINHIAVWTSELERIKKFYVKYFAASSGDKYFNPTKNFTSYFLTFEDGSRLEIMHKPDLLTKELRNQENFIGLSHFSVSVGSRERVDELTEQLREDGYIIAGEPRLTGDGYYESVVLDPDGNRLEITV